MPNVDERIRGEMRGLARPVEVEGVLERVVGRRSRRRVVRRAQALGLAAVVLGGSAAGGLGLVHLFGHPSTSAPGSTGSVHQTVPRTASMGPNPTAAGGSPQPSVEDAICRDSQLNADVDGDGVLDQVDLLTLAPSCTSADGRQLVLHVSGGKLGSSGPGVRYYGADQDFAECREPDACRLFAAPDVNGDGTAELAVQVAAGASTESFALYELEGVDTAGGARFVRIAVAPPGDPWDARYGLQPGPGLFAWGGSDADLHGATCVDRGGQHQLVVRTGLPSTATADAYDVHDTFLALEGDTLTVVGSDDVTVSSQYPLVPHDLCGSPIQSGSR